jgi:hypothetical protein
MAGQFVRKTKVIIMNTMTHQGLMDQDARSLIDDPKKRAADIAQLGNENENRDRRVRERKVYLQKLEARKKARRRQRAFKLAGAWTLVIVAGFIGIAWFSNELVRLIG